MAATHEPEQALVNDAQLGCFPPPSGHFSSPARHDVNNNVRENQIQ